MKYTIANDELQLKGKSGVYCFLPYERLDKSKKSVFKCGMTSRDFTTRLENYHSFYPLGVYMCFFLTVPKLKRGQEKETVIREMEKSLFRCIDEEGGKRLKFPSRPTIKWDYNSEWFYTNFSVLDSAFEKISELYPGSKLYKYDDSDIEKNYKNNMKSKHKYVAEIVYFV